jgi:hypothetical protein
MIGRYGMRGGYFSLSRKGRRREPSLRSGGLMTWMLWVFWILVLVALLVAAETARLDARAREIGEERDEEMGR